MFRLHQGTALAVLASLTILSGSSGVSTSTIDDWPQWRGPRRDGVSAERGLLKQWPAGGPPLVWQTKGAGDGYAG